MTSNNSEKNTEILQFTDDRAKTAHLAKKFNLSAPVSEEEFEDSLQALGNYLLFNTRWDPRQGNDSLPKKLPIIYDVPLVCKGIDCKYAQLCPVLGGMSARDQDKLVGSQCRADKLFGVQNYAMIIKDLDIQPGQAIDLINAANLVRWMIYRRRLDWQLAIEGLTINAVMAVQKGTELGEQKAHPLFKEAERVDKMIDAAQKSLVASRKDRLALAAQFGKEKDVIKNLFIGLGMDNLLEVEDENEQ